MNKLLLAAATALVFAPSAFADRGNDKARADLSGFQEVPVVSTSGSGRVRLNIISDDRIDWELTYEGMEADVTQAHIHVAQRNVNGGIVLWFCGTTIATPPTPGPAGTQVCTPRSGSFSGSFSPASVQTVATQHFENGNLAEVIDFIQRGLTYANVHTLQSPGGEIRGQIREDRHHRGHHDRDD
jgi:hypothetical protein